MVQTGVLKSQQLNPLVLLSSSSVLLRRVELRSIYRCSISVRPVDSQENKMIEYIVLSVFALSILPDFLRECSFETWILSVLIARWTQVSGTSTVSGPRYTEGLITLENTCRKVLLKSKTNAKSFQRRQSSTRGYFLYRLSGECLVGRTRWFVSVRLFANRLQKSPRRNCKQRSVFLSYSNRAGDCL
jgi:hypothetical protein